MTIIDNLDSSCTKTVELCTILTNEDVKLSALAHYRRYCIIKQLNDDYRAVFMMFNSIIHLPLF